MRMRLAPRTRVIGGLFLLSSIAAACSTAAFDGSNGSPKNHKGAPPAPVRDEAPSIDDEPADESQGAELEGASSGQVIVKSGSVISGIQGKQTVLIVEDPVAANTGDAGDAGDQAGDTPRSAQPASDISWESLDESVATVDGNQVTFVGPGSTTIEGRDSEGRLVYTMPVVVTAGEASGSGSGSGGEIGSIEVLLSQNGEPFTSDLSGSKAVASGREITVRLRYDNHGSQPIPDVSIATRLPSGLTLVPGTMKNCLTPTPAEHVCNSDAEQAGAIPDTVWADRKLVLSPTAGLYDISPSQAKGLLEIGRKRYLISRSEAVANFENGNPQPAVSTSCEMNISSNFSNTFMPTYTVPRNPSCGAQSVDLLGKRYFIMRSEAVANFEAGSPRAPNGDSCAANISSHVANRAVPSYTVPGNPSCGAGSQDMLGRRYFFSRSEAVANFENGNPQAPNATSCALNISSSFQTNAVAAYTVPRNPTCGAGTSDLLDAARGSGYIEFRVIADSSANVASISVSMSNDAGLDLTGSGTIEVLAP